MSPKCILPESRSRTPKQSAIKIGPERSGSSITSYDGFDIFRIIIILLLIIYGYIPISNLRNLYLKVMEDLHLSLANNFFLEQPHNLLLEFGISRIGMGLSLFSKEQARECTKVVLLLNSSISFMSSFQLVFIFSKG